MDNNAIKQDEKKFDSEYQQRFYNLEQIPPESEVIEYEIANAKKKKRGRTDSLHSQ